jgi:GalNAc-alpha-(1->4)-GalNAc-alpha-(1->3)-diNAcBac-PP-undecaprenol alpha-1,4-N-acetyl-D-galactosaminyltransferase
VIVSELTDPSLYYIGRKWDLLRRVTYPLADRLVCQTGRALAKFQKMSKVNGSVIPNLIAAPSTVSRRHISKPTEQRDYVVVAMGRLVPQKGFDILLRAFSQIMRRHPSWSLKILGKGPLRDDLKKLSDDLNMTGRVHFTGLRMEPFADVCQADLFVLSSRFEGFPNALCEAMACGLPAVSFDCPSGPSDIVRDGVDGILVAPEDTDALARALDDLMTDGAKRQRLASRAPEILERFADERVLSLWDELFMELTPDMSLRLVTHSVPSLEKVL